jgi:EAL domain-containing protein (putative c-di-GMP-specific phosphodiesterase class I)/DNA-binding CsgD family transcriptional regulator/ActR/RegA family two-component response regulator
MPTQISDGNGQRAMRLLVLDDDEATGRLVSRIATAAGFVAAATTTADEFDSAYRAAVPDMIVLDLQLGDTDGVEQLRALARWQFAGSLILVSGFDSRVLATTKALAGDLGLCVAAALSKPIDVPELRQVLKGIHTRGEPLSVQRLLQAIRTNELILEYQPIVASRTRSLCKLEALVRWQHPELGRLAPDHFIPMAESDAQTINALTDWVIGTAVRDYNWLRAAGIAVPIAVNVSARNLQDLSFPDRVGCLLKLAGIPPDQICFEITETTAFHDATATMDILARLRLKGFQLAIDDFGTGYSSMKMLRQMPFGTLKLDRSFVNDLATSGDSRAITQCIVDLADNMELESIAEGVETEEIATMLEKMGVDFLQGYLISRSMPVNQLPAWLQQWRARAAFDMQSRTDIPAACGVATQDEADAEFAAPIAVASGSTVWADTRPQVAANPPRLTPRQATVMQLLAEGCSVKAMARRLNLGIGTVKTHLSQAYTTLGAHNRVEALRRAGMMVEQPE